MGGSVPDGGCGRRVALPWPGTGLWGKPAQQPLALLQAKGRDFCTPSGGQWLGAGVGRAQLPRWAASRQLRALVWRQGQLRALSSDTAGPRARDWAGPMGLPAGKLFMTFKMPGLLTQHPLFQGFACVYPLHMWNDVIAQMGMAARAKPRRHLRVHAEGQVPGWHSGIHCSR